MLTIPSLNVLLHFVISTHLQTSRCLLVFSSENFNVKLENPFVYINVINGTFPSDLLFQSYGCKDIFIQTEGLSKFLDHFEDLIKKHKDRFTSRRYLFISDGSKGEFKNFFENKNLKFIMDILYVFPTIIKGRWNVKNISQINDDVVYELWTHEFGGPENNFRNPILVDVWFSKNYSFLYNNNLYPDKISDQKGKALKVAAITYPPYTVVGESLEEADGTEMNYAKIYAEKHGMKMELVVNAEELWGDIYDNWTGNGILGEVVMDKSDFGIAAIYQWEIVYRYLEMSKPTVKAGVTCLVPAPRLSAGWLMPLFSFTSSMWIAFGVAFLFSAFYLWYLQWKWHKSLGHTVDSVFLVLAIFLQQSISDFQLKKAIYISAFIMSLLILSLFISASYSSGLASSMTIPRYDDPIRTVEDLARSGIFWGTTAPNFINSIKGSEEANYKQIVKKFRVFPEAELVHKAREGTFGLILERTPFGHYAAVDFITEETVYNFNLMVEDLYWDYCIFATRKNSVLLPSLDSLILRITQSGLLHYWEIKVTEKHANVKVQNILRYLATHHDKKSEFTKLKWTHVQGAFGILVIGNLAAIVCFIMELAAFRLCGSNRILELH